MGATRDNATNSDDEQPLELPISRKPVISGRREASVQKSKASANTTTSNVVDDTPRDPRFDPRCAGNSDIRHFTRNYSFLDDVRHKEINELEKALRKATDEEKRSKIRLTINRLKNKMVENKNKVKQLSVVDELKAHKRQELGGRKRPLHVNKSQIKKKLMVDKYKELKESGKLSKYLERKRKKLINRDGKSFV